MWGRALGLMVALILPTLAGAQGREAPVGWIWVLEGFAAGQGETDLDQGGAFSSNRFFLRGGGLYRFQSGNTAGLLLRRGQLNYDFTGAAAPWGDINDLRISVPLRFRAGERVSLFASPSLRYDYEQGAARSEGRSYGLFAGITWDINARLTIGPGFGAFTEIGTDSWDVFPALLVDWQFAEAWSLTTGSGAGATQGPGVAVVYRASDAWSLSLGARYESLRFRLDNTGIARGGVGEDSSVPVVLGARYAPYPGLSLDAFVGAELNGSLTLEDAGGTRISRQDYDTAPVAGFTFRLAF